MLLTIEPLKSRTELINDLLDDIAFIEEEIRHFDPFFFDGFISSLRELFERNLQMSDFDLNNWIPERDILFECEIKQYYDRFAIIKEHIIAWNEFLSTSN